MADKTPISQLPAGALTGANVDVDADYLAIDDVSAGNTKKITPRELIANAPAYTPTGTIAATSVQGAIDEVVSDLAASGGAALVGFVQSGSGPIAETVQGALRRVSVQAASFMTEAQRADVTSNTGALDVSAAIQAAIDWFTTSGGVGGTVQLPYGVCNIGTTSIVGRTYVEVVGFGKRSTLINYTGSAGAFVFDGKSQGGLRGVRIGLGSSATSIGLDIKTTSASMLRNKFSDIEIASNNTAGQIGVKAVASGGQIVSENWFEDFYITGVDKPIVKNGIEGNFWYGIDIADYGNGASPCGVLDTACHAEEMDVRVAGVRSEEHTS